MAKIKPFRAIKYSSKVDISKNICLPYDKISSMQLSQYEEESQHNISRVMLPALGQKKSDYNHSFDLMQSWIKDSILEEDDTDSLYLYEQEFSLPHSPEQRKKRTALVAMVFMDDSVIRPHEKTLDKPKADRLQLMKKTGMNFGQIFTLFNDKKRVMAKLFQEHKKENTCCDLVTPDNIHHRLWKVDNTRSIGLIQEFFEDKSLYIADGHHRYATAKQYRDEFIKKQKNTPPLINYRLMSLVDSSDEGLVVLPTHRVLKNLENLNVQNFLDQLNTFFSVTTFKKTEGFSQAMNQFNLEKSSHSFILDIHSDSFYRVCVLKTDVPFPEGVHINDNALNRCFVSILNELILKKMLSVTEADIANESYLIYERSTGEVCRQIDSGEAQMAFIVKPTTVQEIMEVADESLFMPQKSTDFFPKLYTGVLMSRVSDPLL